MSVFAVEWWPALAAVATFVARLAGVALLVGAGYVVVRAISRIARVALEQVGFDAVVERGALRRVLARSSHGASDVVSKAVFVGLFLLVLQAALGVFGENVVNDLATRLVAVIPAVLAVLTITAILSAVVVVLRSSRHDGAEAPERRAVQERGRARSVDR